MCSSWLVAGNSSMSSLSSEFPSGSRNISMYPVHIQKKYSRTLVYKNISCKTHVSVYNVSYPKKAPVCWWLLVASQQLGSEKTGFDATWASIEGSESKPLWCQMMGVLFLVFFSKCHVSNECTINKCWEDLCKQIDFSRWLLSKNCGVTKTHHRRIFLFRVLNG